MRVNERLRDDLTKMHGSVFVKPETTTNQEPPVKLKKTIWEYPHSKSAHKNKSFSESGYKRGCARCRFLMMIESGVVKRYLAKNNVN